MVKNSIIWTIGIVIAIFSGLVAVGAIAKNKAPQLAIKMHPANGFAAENLASTLTKSLIQENGGQFPDQVNANVKKLARQAFIAEPIAPQAVALLALGMPERNRRELMLAARSLSRREQLVTAWLIADSVAREDIPAILDQYDTMARTSSTAASAVIPVMAEALANDSFIAPFANLLTKQPPWANQFWATVVGIPASLGNAARLREELYKPNESNEAYRDAELISALISSNKFQQGQHLYHLLTGQSQTDVLVENYSFKTDPIYPPIDWQLFSTGEYGAVITDGKLVLSAIRNSGGLFARQVVKLPPRVLTVDARLDGAVSNNAQIFLALTCAQAINNAPRPIRIPLDRDISNLRIDNSRSGCEFYWLDVNGRASEGGDGFDIAIEAISLR